ncbi:WG repeat-containing protein [Tamlana agarivorans]|uniref:WG repeat-containing protein n=1 Tax=Pseudotamlana agarivorans TaxID=481183 RepID=A0ACC5UCM0_9FLAO|nr:WG repeat-containing protein [Tamlana agarivorans]MBU2951940.1 WG repeat-containing protein [Tamlana agarivorans]
MDINTKGVWGIEPKFASCFRFTEGLAVAKRPGMKTTGYINKTGEMVISEKFKIALPFKNVLAYVKDKKRRGYINNLGEFVWKSK